MTLVLTRPDAPTADKISHYSAELVWADSLEKAREALKAAAIPETTQIIVFLQEQDNAGSWINIYHGYGSRHVVDHLQPSTSYNYRIRFSVLEQESDWSLAATLTTNKEPLSGFHLHKAVAANDRIGVEKTLEEAGHKITDIYDKFGFSPLMQAAQKGFVEIVDVLLDYGANVNLQNEAGMTALMLATYKSQLESVEVLVQRGADVKISDHGGCTVLHWASDSGSGQIINYLVRKGADVNSADKNGWTPLIRCTIIGGHIESAKALIKNGADVNHKDKDGKTALMMAVTNNHMRIVELLVQSDVDVKATNQSGKTAIDFARSMERRLITKLLEPYYSDSQP